MCLSRYLPVAADMQQASSKSVCLSNGIFGRQDHPAKRTRQLGHPKRDHTHQKERCFGTAARRFRDGVSDREPKNVGQKGRKHRHDRGARKCPSIQRFFEECRIIIQTGFIFSGPNPFTDRGNEQPVIRQDNQHQKPQQDWGKQ